jgi:hypothetical protein
MPKKEEEIFKNIADKNRSNFYLPKTENISNFRYTNPEIIQSMVNEIITNILIPDAIWGTNPNNEVS